MADSSPKQQQEQCKLENLPEHILLHILSFLPTKTAAATAVLSRTWRHRWTLVPCLDLHHSPYRLTFSNMVTNALDRNKVPFLRRFHLVTDTYGPVYHSDLLSWLSSTMERTIHDLDLDLFRIFYDQYCFDPKNFVLCLVPKFCNTLVSLKLRTFAYGRILIGGSLDDLYFPALKILHLKRSGLEFGDVSLPGFLTSSRFPLLEELVVYESKFDHDEINISLSTLRWLEINFTALKFGGRTTLKIDCPALRYLVVKDSISRGFRVGSLPNLVEANVDVFNTSEVEDEIYGESLVNLIRSLLNVRSLKLSLYTMVELHRASLCISQFHNLVKVDIDLDGSILSLAMVMLHKFENIQHLTFHMKPCLEDENIEWVPPTQVPNCLTCRLTTFCFHEFEGSDTEMEVTKYILKNSMALKNVKIIFLKHVTTLEKRNHFERELSTASKGSVGCELEFSLSSGPTPRFIY